MATICQEQEGRLCASVAQAAQQELNQQKDAWHPRLGKPMGKDGDMDLKWISYDLMGLSNWIWDDLMAIGYGI